MSMFHGISPWERLEAMRTWRRGRVLRGEDLGVSDQPVLDKSMMIDVNQSWKNLGFLEFF